MEKPKFLSKAEREKLRLQEEQKPKQPIKSSFFSSTNTKPVKRDVEPNPIKEQYLVPQMKKKRRTNEKKFNFDWNADEDTTADYQIQPKQKEMKLPYKFMDERNWRDKLLNEMTERDWRIFREDYRISIKGAHIPPPLRSWKESEIPQAILSVIKNVGYHEPTPIQRQAIPIAMAQRDIIGIAETGSGKTASFVIPMLHFISQLPALDYNNSHLGPYGLVLAPTRELALQIEQETKKFCQEMGLICVAIVGGHSYTSQSNNLIQGAHILIATPGRLVDFVDRQVLALSQCYYVVLDEADRMVDLGFEEPLQKILDAMPATNLKPDTDLAEDTTWLRQQLKNPYRQTVMFSATMPTAVEKLAKQYLWLTRYLRRPVQVIVGQVGQVVDRIEQRAEFIEEEGKKLTRLGQILNSREFEPPMIVFVNMKKNCEVVSRYLDKFGYRCVALHGGKSQDAREFALQSLKDGKKDVLVATDVAGRGIDVKNVSLVINFDMAKNIQDYTHRIGRTGRAGKKGIAITFWGNQDKDVLYDLKMVLQKSPNSIVPPELARHEAALAKPSLTDGGGNFKRK